MRIPHIINRNTHATYEPSPETKELVDENARRLLPENFDWDQDHCGSLATFCVDAIKAAFATKPLLDELPCPDRDYLLEILDVNLPLELVIPLINEEIYWKKRFADKYGPVLVKKTTNWSWKTLFVERYMQELLEQAQPQHNDEEGMAEITTLCCPYVKRLLVTQLQAWKPPLHWDKEDIPEVYPIDHIDFAPVFENLKNIEEFSVIYGVNNVADNFSWNHYKLSVNDCERLGKSVQHLKSLRILRIHRSKLEDRHINVLMHGLVKNQTLQELDLSHCLIGDHGALCIAKALLIHPVLQILNLTNNKIKQTGSEGIAFAVLQPGSCPLKKLGLKMNPLGEEGAMGIMRALVREQTIEELSLASCMLEGDAPVRVGQMLRLNTSLKKLDVSNNWFDEDGGEALIAGMQINKTLEWLDVRETDITQEQEEAIKKYLRRNRLGMDDVSVSGVNKQLTEAEAKPAVDTEIKSEHDVKPQEN